MHFLAAEESAPNVLQVPVVELVIGGLAFLIVMAALWKLVLPGVQRVLAERVDAIEGGLRRAEEAQAQAQATLEQYQQQLAQARTEAAEIRAQAQADKAQIVEEARAEATAAAQLVTERAQAQIQADRRQAFASLQRQVGDLSVLLAGKVVGETLQDDTRVSATVDRFLAELDGQAQTAEQARNA